MPTYLYCLRNDSVAPPHGCTGVDGERVRALDAAGLMAWVSDVGDSRLAATVERLRAHDRVCSAALAAGETPLPIRFGQTFATDHAAVQAIGSRRSVLVERLARVAGCVELRLVLTGRRDAMRTDAQRPAVEGSRDQPTEKPGPGTAFLRRLAREGREDIAREAECEEARRAITTTGAAALIVEHRRCESRRGVSYFPMLVRRADVDRCREAVRRTLLATGIEPSLLGPFPPYSFAPDA